jgi:phosphoribosylformimino-5-aminoimidazole carboxamide ribotide isomerase
MLSGMNFHEMKKILNITSIPLIASGGVTSISDIRELTKISDQGVSGVIIGKALYEKKVNLIDVFKIIGN